EPTKLALRAQRENQVADVTQPAREGIVVFEQRSYISSRSRELLPMQQPVPGAGTTAARFRAMTTWQRFARRPLGLILASSLSVSPIGACSSHSDPPPPVD